MCMGTTHSTSGAALYLGLCAATPISAPLLTGVLGVQSTTMLLTGAFIAAGAALLPDLDHHSSTVTRALPPFTSIIGRVIGLVSGGHRHGTHSLVGAAFFAFLAWLASFWLVPVDPIVVPLLDHMVWPGGYMQVGAVLYAFILAGLGLSTIPLTKNVPVLGKAAPWVGAAVGAYLVAFHAPGNPVWLPVVVALGCIAHNIGDGITVQGVPWLWPLLTWGRISHANGRFLKQNGRISVNLLGATGGVRERLFEMLLTLYVVTVILLLAGISVQYVVMMIAAVAVVLLAGLIFVAPRMARSRA